MTGTALACVGSVPAVLGSTALFRTANAFAIAASASDWAVTRLSATFAVRPLELEYSTTVTTVAPRRCQHEHGERQREAALGAKPEPVQKAPGHARVLFRSTRSSCNE